MAWCRLLTPRHGAEADMNEGGGEPLGLEDKLQEIAVGIPLEPVRLRQVA